MEAEAKGSPETSLVYTSEFQDSHDYTVRPCPQTKTIHTSVSGILFQLFIDRFIYVETMASASQPLTLTEMRLTLCFCSTVCNTSLGAADRYHCALLGGDGSSVAKLLPLVREVLGGSIQASVLACP